MDVSCDEIPPRGSILHLKESPPQGGDTLFDHISRTPSIQCRVRWQPGTLVVWDNRAVQHFAVWDYHPHVRRGERVSICGTAPPAAAFPAPLQATVDGGLQAPGGP